MLRDFNLLVTTSRGNEDHVCSELSYLFDTIGDSTPIVTWAGISGLVTVRSALDPFEVVTKFRLLLHKHPYEFRYTLRVIPIERVVRTYLDQIKIAAADLASKIGKNETFRVTVEKRCTEKSSRDMIEVVATDIRRRVNLSQPDKILLIEVIGELTGVSVIEPNDILSVLKEKIL